MLPAYILVKLGQTCAASLQGLDEGVLAIVPASMKYQIMIFVKPGGQASNFHRKVCHVKDHITPANAFTDYPSQDQTIPFTIVDIAKPPTGGELNLFDTYITLLISSDHNTIRLLRRFDQKLLMELFENNSADGDERLLGGYGTNIDMEIKAGGQKIL
jgi:hypothetical protein